MAWVKLYLFVLAEETRAPAALAAGPGIHPVPTGEDLVTGGGVKTPRQLGVGRHVGVQHCGIELWGGERGKWGSFCPLQRSCPLSL